MEIYQNQLVEAMLKWADGFLTLFQDYTFNAQNYYFTLEDRELLEALDEHPNNIFHYIPLFTH